MDYLSDNLHYNLGYDEQQGLRLFHEYSMELNLAPSNRNFDAAFQYSKLS
jgi:predicted solute-binding protein